MNSTETTLINNHVLMETHKDMVVRASKDGFFEPETFKYIDEHLEKGSVFLDVGAYTGVYSIYCAKVRQASCIAFEPNERVYQRLLSNLELNKVSEHVQTVQCCLSSVRGSAHLFTNPNTEFSSGGSLVPDLNRIVGQHVSLIPFDETPFSDNPVDMVKIDVEGQEYDVLLGMEDVIRMDHPDFIIECLDIDAKNKVDRFMKHKGYSFKGIYDRRNFVYSVY